MSTQQTSASRHLRLPVAALLALALTAAVLVVAIDATSIRSARIDPPVPRVPAQSVPTANPVVPTSPHTSKGCWRRKFGCGQGATTTTTTTTNPDLGTSSRVLKGCWPKFGCVAGSTTPAKRP